MDSIWNKLILCSIKVDSVWNKSIQCCIKEDSIWNKLIQCCIKVDSIPNRTIQCCIKVDSIRNKIIQCCIRVDSIRNMQMSIAYLRKFILDTVKRKLNITPNYHHSVREPAKLCQVMPQMHRTFCLATDATAET